MSILPEHMRDCFNKAEMAVLDIAVPDDLMESVVRAEWGSYVRNLSPARMVEKFAEALDAFTAESLKHSDSSSLSCEDKEAVFSKWAAADIVANSAIRERFFYHLPRGEADKFDSDTDLSIFFVIDFLKGSASDALAEWEQRRKDYNVQNRRQSIHEVVSKIWHDVYMIKDEPGAKGGGDLSPS